MAVTKDYVLYNFFEPGKSESEKPQLSHVFTTTRDKWTLDDLSDLADHIKSYVQDQDLIEALY